MKLDTNHRCLKSTAAFMVTFALVLPSPGATIGYVVDPGADIDELFDIFWTERLEEQGHEIEPIGADEPADDFEVDFFIISNDVASGDVVNGFGIDDPRPMITSGEWGLNDEWGMADIQGENTDAISITIQEPSHPLAAGLTGDVDVFDDLQPVSTILGELAPDIQVIATVDNGFEDVPAIAVLEPGSANLSTIGVDPTPGLRVFLFSRTHPEGGDLYNENGLAILDAAIDFALGIGGNGPPELQPGDSDMDLDFDQFDLVKVQVAAKYLTGQAATWGDGDWNGAPGGEPGNPPAGDSQFNQLDIVSALGAGKYLTGPYAAIKEGGTPNDGQTSLVYNTGSGELSVDSPSGKNLTSINITSAASRFVGDKPATLDGAFDNFAADNVFKATFGGSFGSISFGNVLPAGLTEDEVATDLSAVGSLEGGGDLGEVDLVFVPEPTTMMIGALSLCALLGTIRRGNRA